ncbi:hypothetical protein BDW74DRAFT_159068 [Aspergillus multicolor]|uniref:uncharacterized protein n=1 Tax=Aspergillus multicolor TaxID=41759 RepID=UPI003CCE4435
MHGSRKLMGFRERIAGSALGGNDVTKQEFIEWNPSLAENMTAVGPPVTTTWGHLTRSVQSDERTYPCTLATSTSYRVRLHAPTQPPSVPEEDYFYLDYMAEDIM